MFGRFHARLKVLHVNGLGFSGLCFGALARSIRGEIAGKRAWRARVTTTACIQLKNRFGFAAESAKSRVLKRCLLLLAALLIGLERLPIVQVTLSHLVIFNDQRVIGLGAQASGGPVGGTEEHGPRFVPAIHIYQEFVVDNVTAGRETIEELAGAG